MGDIYRQRYMHIRGMQMWYMKCKPYSFREQTETHEINTQRFRNAGERDDSDQLDGESLHLGSWHESNCSVLALMTFRYCFQL